MLTGVRQRLVGEIFDSCPCYMYTDGGLSMIELGTKRWLARMLLKAGYMSQCIIAGSLSILGNNPTLAEEYWQHCEAWPTSCRQARRATRAPHAHACAAARPLCALSALSTPPVSPRRRPRVTPPTQLFIYSSADDVCDLQPLEQLIAKREAQGVPVAKLCFQKSLHVMHYRTYPWLYQAAVLHHAGLVTPGTKEDAEPEAEAIDARAAQQPSAPAAAATEG